MVMSTAERNRMLAQMKARANAQHVINVRRMLSQPGLAAPTYRIARGGGSSGARSGGAVQYKPRESLENKMKRIQHLLALQRAQRRRLW